MAIYLLAPLASERNDDMKMRFSRRNGEEKRRGDGGEPICKALTRSPRLFEVITKTVQIKGFDKSESAPNNEAG